MTESWIEEIIKKGCPACNLKVIVTLTPHLIHYARVDCPVHGFRGWISNPNKEKLEIHRKQISIQQVLDFHNKKEEICFLCLRKRNQLGRSETLTIDHIEELKANEGKDSIENMQILCTACHKLKNWARLYINWHLNGKEIKEEVEDGKI